MQEKIQIFKHMHSDIENKEVIRENDLPSTEDAQQKVVHGKISGLGTGALLVGGAVVGCFALALWNRKALVALVKNRGHRKNPTEANAAQDADAIY